MKLSTSIRHTREAIKSLRIGTSRLEIEAKEENCTTARKEHYSTSPSFSYIYVDAHLLSCSG